MKKLIAVAALSAGLAAVAAPAVAGASSPYPPTTDDPGSVSPVPFDALASGAAVTADGGVLPTTGSNEFPLLQVGAVTLGLGIALAGGATFRRRRLTLA